jgi:hypothetical protein
MGQSFPTPPPDPHAQHFMCPYGVGHQSRKATRQEHLISEIRLAQFDLAERIAALEARLPPKPEEQPDG